MSRRPRNPLPDDFVERQGPANWTVEHPRAVAADAVRDAIDVLVSKDVPDAVLLEEAAVIDASTQRMIDAAAPGKRVRMSPDYDAHPQDFFPNGPTAGWANPLALPITLWGIDGSDGGVPEIRGEATFSLAYEGPPTCVHGGVISLIFDEILGNANIIAQAPGMTVELKVTYRKPTPLMTPLTLEAKVTSVDGRKIRSWAAIRNNGEITAEAEGLFIAVDPEQMMKFAKTHAENTEHDVADAEMRQMFPSDD